MMKVNFKYFGIFLILFVITYPFASSNMVLAQEDQSAQIVETLLQNTKIVRPEMVLKDFMNGKTITRVIVNLSKPANFQQITNLNDMELRKELQGSVKKAQDRVINIVDSREFRITNRFTYIFGFSAEVTLDGLWELTQVEEVVSINKDRILEPHLAQGIPLMNASTVRNTYNGSGISIAICDTGIDYNHPMLGDASFPNTKVIGGHDCGDNDADPMDDQGHGTCCAGIAAGDLGYIGDYIGGVAYNARLYALKISYGINGSAYGSDMIEAWEWCITHQNDDPDNPIMVISTSFGGGYYTSSCDSESTAMTQAAANCVAAGMTLFISSGNDGYCDGMGWPACITHVNAVGAVYDDGFGTCYPCVSAESCATKYYTSTGCSPYSNYYAIDLTAADMVTSYSNTASFLDLLAPSNQSYTADISGSGGYSTGDYDDSFGGTSAACPYAAGSAACLQNAAKSIQGSFLTPAEVKSKLSGTGDLVTDGKIIIAKPRVNLGAAIETLNGTCTYAIDPASANVGLYGGSGSVDVTADPGCSWEASSNVYWISITSGSSGTGNGTVMYMVYRSRTARTGTVTIAGKTFTVSQGEAGTCTYAIDPASADFNASVGSGSVSVTTQSGCSWTAASDDAWIHIISGDSGTGSGTVNYSVDANTGSSRTGTVTIAGQTFTVSQGEAGTCTYSIDPAGSNFGLYGGSGSVYVTADPGCSWEASSNAYWISINSGSSGTGNGTVTYMVYRSRTARTGTVTIAGQTFTVSQGEAGACTYSIDPASADFNASGGSGSVSVATQSGCSWTAASDDAWIHIISGDSGTGSGTVNYSVDANTGSSRTGTVTIAGQTFTVSQGEAGTCTYSIDPASSDVGLHGGSGSVFVTADPGCSWEASSNAYWISITSGSSGTGNGTVTYMVYRSRTARTGTVTIAGQTFTVSQQ
jgi:subtilisin family serine protease